MAATTDKSSQMNLDGVIARHWKDVPAKEFAPGLNIRLLWTGEHGRKALMFEIAPGAVYPDLDVHAPGAEEVFVVSGDFCDGQNTYPAGTFIHHPAGSSHVPQSKDGCVLFVFFPEG